MRRDNSGIQGLHLTRLIVVTPVVLLIALMRCYDNTPILSSSSERSSHLDPENTNQLAQALAIAVVIVFGYLSLRRQNDRPVTQEVECGLAGEQELSDRTDVSDFASSGDGETNENDRPVTQEVECGLAGDQELSDRPDVSDFASSGDGETNQNDRPVTQTVECGLAGIGAILQGLSDLAQVPVFKSSGNNNETQIIKPINEIVCDLVLLSRKLDPNQSIDATALWAAINDAKKLLDKTDNLRSLGGSHSLNTAGNLSLENISHALKDKTNDLLDSITTRADGFESALREIWKIMKGERLDQSKYDRVAHDAAINCLVYKECGKLKTRVNDKLPLADDGFSGEATKTSFDLFKNVAAHAAGVLECKLDSTTLKRIAGSRYPIPQHYVNTFTGVIEQMKESMRRLTQIHREQVSGKHRKAAESLATMAEKFVKDSLGTQPVWVVERRVQGNEISLKPTYLSSVDGSFPELPPIENVQSVYSMFSGYAWSESMNKLIILASACKLTTMDLDFVNFHPSCIALTENNPEIAPVVNRYLACLFDEIDTSIGSTNEGTDKKIHWKRLMDFVLFFESKQGKYLRSREGGVTQFFNMIFNPINPKEVISALKELSMDEIRLFNLGQWSSIIGAVCVSLEHEKTQLELARSEISSTKQADDDGVKRSEVGKMSKQDLNNLHVAYLKAKKDKVAEEPNAEKLEKTLKILCSFQKRGLLKNGEENDGLLALLAKNEETAYLLYKLLPEKYAAGPHIDKEIKITDKGCLSDGHPYGGITRDFAGFIHDQKNQINLFIDTIKQNHPMQTQHWIYYHTGPFLSFLEKNHEWLTALSFEQSDAVSKLLLCFQRFCFRRSGSPLMSIRNRWHTFNINGKKSEEYVYQWVNKPDLDNTINDALFAEFITSNNKDLSVIVRLMALGFEPLAAADSAVDGDPVVFGVPVEISLLTKQQLLRRVCRWVLAQKDITETHSHHLEQIFAGYLQSLKHDIEQRVNVGDSKDGTQSNVSNPEESVFAGEGMPIASAAADDTAKPEEHSAANVVNSCRGLASSMVRLAKSSLIISDASGGGVDIKTTPIPFHLLDGDPLLKFVVRKVIEDHRSDLTLADPNIEDHCSDLTLADPNIIERFQRVLSSVLVCSDDTADADADADAADTDAKCDKTVASAHSPVIASVVKTGSGHEFFQAITASLDISSAIRKFTSDAKSPLNKNSRKILNLFGLGEPEVKLTRILVSKRENYEYKIRYSHNDFLSATKKAYCNHLIDILFDKGKNALLAQIQVDLREEHEAYKGMKSTIRAAVQDYRKSCRSTSKTSYLPYLRGFFSATTANAADHDRNTSKDGSKDANNKSKDIVVPAAPPRPPSGNEENALDYSGGQSHASSPKKG